MRRRSVAQCAMILFIQGCVLGSFGDLCHVYSGTDAYPIEGMHFPGLPILWWVPMLFGFGGMMTGLTHPALDQITGTWRAPRPGVQSVPHVLAGLGLMLTVWAGSGFLPLDTGGGKDVFVALVAIGAWWILDRTPIGILYGVVTGIIGTLVEVSQIRIAHTFYYLPGYNNLWEAVPSWLPWLYFCASVTVGNLGRYLAHGPVTISKAKAK